MLYTALVQYCIQYCLLNIVFYNRLFLVIILTLAISGLHSHLLGGSIVIIGVCKVYLFAFQTVIEKFKGAESVVRELRLQKVERRREEVS